GLSAKVIDMQPYKAPDEFIKALGAEAYQERIDAAENSFLFEIRMLERDYDLSDPESKTAFFRKAAERLLEFREPLERENYIEAVTRRYGIGFDQLRSMVNRAGARGGIAAERKPLKSGVHENKKKEDGMKKSQRLLLTWLVEDPALFDRIGQYIGPEDFTEELYRQTAQIVFDQHARGEINPAQIISLFPDEEQQREIAQIFHARIGPVEEAAEREKALNETVRRVKQNSIEHRSKCLDPTDVAGLQKIIEDRKSLAKLHISID
ncbi:MAG: DNA primase, partial [Lachnospiraceae bacterium]|nr:DNA primase [Lachnospiraceae bacterium]